MTGRRAVAVAAADQPPGRIGRRSDTAAVGTER